MDKDITHSFSSRATHRPERTNRGQRAADDECSLLLSDRSFQESSLKPFWKKSFIRLILAAGILWIFLMLVALLFQVWSCQLTLISFRGLCRRDGQIYHMLDTVGLMQKPVHRCLIPLADDPNSVATPEKRNYDDIPQKLSYFVEDEFVGSGSQYQPLFGGHQNWKQREESFKLNTSMKVHCGFMKNGGAEMDPVDIHFAKGCKFVVASGIFDGYDIPHQPSNISMRSKKLFCFLMVIDERTLAHIRANGSIKEDNDGGKWVGIWRLVTLHKLPYDEPRRNGKVPKILTHRLFPQARYSIWIDGKMELIVDPLLILERYLWRGGYTFAIARHKHHKSIYEEADANKRRKRYARPLIDLHMKIYVYEGMKPWSPKKKTVSDVPEGAIIIREHTPLNNLFCCLWFNEVHMFTPRDQLSFGYVVYRLGDHFKFHMFPNCEYNSLFILHKHTREHSSKVEWVKSLSEFEGNNTGLRETKGGLGLWTPYPGNLDLVEIPPVSRVSEHSR
ncbi:unnamed protein product [Victoria cruziana]